MTEPSASIILKPRLHWVDALRGIAAIAVMFSHYIWTPLAPQEGIWHYLISPGEFGVAAFFCVSGFIIPFSVKNVSGLGAVGFAVNRAFRLYPLYWLCLALTIAVVPVSIRQALINATMLQRFVGVTDVIPVFWTLQVEIVFYVVIAAFVATALSNRSMAFVISGFVTLAGVLACALIRHVLGHKAPVALFTGLSVMFAIAAYYENIRVPQIKPHVLRALFAATLVVLPVSWLIAYDRNWGSGEVPYLSALTMVISYGLAVIAFFAASSRTGRIPRVLIYAGEISYPLYLFHEPMHHLLSQLIEPFVGFWMTSALAALATCVLAAGIHQWLELPMIALGKRASNRWRSRPRSGVQVMQSPA